MYHPRFSFKSSHLQAIKRTNPLGLQLREEGSLHSKAYIDETDGGGRRRGQRRLVKEPAEEVDGGNCGGGRRRQRHQ